MYYSDITTTSHADVTAASHLDVEASGDPRLCLIGSLVDDAEAVEAAKVRIGLHMVSILIYIKNEKENDDS